MTRFASRTRVTQDRSRAEIEGLLMRYGADEFAYATKRSEALIGFTYRGLQVKMTIPLPERDDSQFTETPTGLTCSERQAVMHWERECRRRWRSFCLVIKALLVGVADGVLRFEEAFMPYIVWGNGLTTSQLLLPHVLKALEDGRMPGSLKQLEGSSS